MQCVAYPVEVADHDRAIETELLLKRLDLGGRCVVAEDRDGDVAW